MKVWRSIQHPDADAEQATRHTERPPDLIAVAVLVVLSLALFGPHLLGTRIYIGDSDRLNASLNLRLLQVTSLQDTGRVPAWADQVLMGASLDGLHWMVPGLDPIAMLMALAPADQLLVVAGYVSALHVALAALTSYLFLRAVIDRAFPSVVGAVIYVCSSFSIGRIGQLDAAHAVLIAAPVGLWLLRTVRPGRTAWHAAALTALLAALFGFGFLQESGYVLLLWLAYAAYRTVAQRDYRPLAILAVGGFAGLLIALPRLLTVLAGFREAFRSSSFLRVCSCEGLRLFDDGIFGRYPGEALALGNGINLHEGFQLSIGTTAAFLLLVGVLRPRSLASLLLGSMIVATLLLALWPYLGNAVRIGALLAAVGLAASSLARILPERRSRPTEPRFCQNTDLPFFLFFTALVLALLLFDMARWSLYVISFRIDFSHTRIVAAGLLPVCLLVAVALDEMLALDRGEPATAHRLPLSRVRERGAGGRGDRGAPWWDVEGRMRPRHLGVVRGRPALDRRHGRPAAWRSLLIGLLLAAAVIAVLDPLGTRIAGALFGAADRVTLTPAAISASTAAIGRVVVLGLAVAVLVSARWLSRRAAPSGPLFARRLPAYTLGCLMLFQAFGDAYTRLNGPQTQTYPAPFLDNNFFTAPANSMQIPSAAAIANVAERLEVDRYRSIVVPRADGYPMFNAPSERGYTAYVAQLWRLRLADGYPGLPRRMVALPWPETATSLRGISFKQADALPWPLLAILNVKYAIIASPPLIFGGSLNEGGHWSEARPDDIAVIRNPLPPVPRAFFAQAIAPQPVTDPPDMTASAAPAGVQSALPKAPQGVRTSLVRAQTAAVTWRATDPETTHHLFVRQIAPSKAPGPQLAISVAAGERYGELTGLSIGSAYEVFVQACDRRGCGDLSDGIELRTGDGKTEPPYPITTAATSSTELTVQWQHPDPRAVAHIELSTPQGEPVGSPVEAPPGSDGYAFGSIRPLTTYTVRIQMCVPEGCSIHSPESSVTVPSSLTAADLRGKLPADPLAVSFVEGIHEPMMFDAPASPIQAAFHADRIQIDVEAASSARFLVLNEMYHPDWHAYAGSAQLPILPTNTVMRGLVVPAGVTHIEMRFEPFFRSWAAVGLAAVGVLAAVAGAFGLRRLDARGTARPEVTAGRPPKPPSLSAPDEQPK